MYSDLLFIAAIVFLSLSIGTVLLYYKRISRAYKKYEEARDAVKDIVVSFNSQLRRLEKSFEGVAHKLEFLSVIKEDITGITEQLRKHEEKLRDVTSKVDEALAIREQVLPQIKELNEKINKVIEKQEKMEKRVSKAEEIKIEGVIPIRKERALAQLTATELNVLEILASEGQKTAPEIKDRIGLTREHTARLMKKLYEKGYVERDEAKTPYEYSIKEEMRKILKKTEAVS